MNNSLSQFLNEQIKNKSILKSGSVNKIVLKLDHRCSMATTFVNDVCVYDGNFWDYYSGCHGSSMNFSSKEGYVNLLERAIKEAGYQVVSSIDTWSWEEDVYIS